MGNSRAAPDREARPFTLGQEAFHPTARLAGLDRIGERMARQLRFIVEPYARIRTEVAAAPLELMRFDSWKSVLPTFTSLSLYRMRPMKGGVLIAVEPSFVTRLVDSFYGGSGRIGKPKAEFTATEDRLLAGLTDAIVQKLAETWADVVTLVPSLAARETNSAYATLVPPDEGVLIQRFAISAGNAGLSEVVVVYPLASVRPFEGQLAAKVHDEAGPADADWRERLARAVENVRLPVRSVLARPELSVSQLMQLKVGDIIPITLAAKAPLIVANRKLAHGSIGEREGRAALLIEQVGGADE